MKQQINPTAGFIEATIKKIEKAHNHRYLLERVLIVVYIFIPVILRQIWLLARNDYFSIGRLPFSEHICCIYKFFMSSVTGTYLLGIGMVSAFMYLWGIRLLTPGYKRLTHFFPGKA